MQRYILVVDSNKEFVNEFKYIFNEKEYRLDYTDTSKRLLQKIKEKNYDLIILERENIDGLELCKNIRKISTVPIIILSENDEEMSKILAFKYGADDYLVKPFNIVELKLRIETIFRRMDYNIEIPPKHIFETNNFTINFLKRSIMVKNKNIELTGKEFDLFYVLISNPSKVFTREELLDKVWGYEHYGDVRTVDVHIRRIRRKIENQTKDQKYIMTEWGKGYYFTNKDLVSQ